MSEHVAYSFKSDLSLGEIFSRLQHEGPWRWFERDNDRWDSYLSAAPLGDSNNVMVKIFVEDRGLYVVDLLFRYREEDPAMRARFDEARKTLFERILPALAARDLAKAEPRE